MGRLPTPWLIFPVALLAAEGSFRVAERPMHRWSRSHGDRGEKLTRDGGPGAQRQAV